MFIAVAVAVIVVTAVLLVNLSPEYSWLSSIRDHDGDGVPDAEDDFPYDENETADRDGDGVGDNADEFPLESSQWSDLDGDGYGDNLTGINPDQFRDDPTEWNDTDGDGVGDNSDAFPEDPDLWEAMTLIATYSKVAVTNGQQISIVSITRSNVSWDLIKVQLTDGTNFAEWDTVSTDLDGGSAVTMNYTTDALGALTVCLHVTDVGGNGFVSSTDYFKVFTYGGATEFSGTAVYLAVLVYTPTGERIGTGISFSGLDETTPVVTYSKQSIPGGQQINIVSITRSDVSWDLIKVQLSDGTNFAEWDIVSTDLDGGSAVTMNYTTDALGALTVCLHVTDVSGNGFVSGTDYFKVFTYGGATPFSSGISYLAVLVYTPTGERMGTGISFTGSVETTPTATYAKVAIANGQQIVIVSITRLDVSWDLVKVQLSDGTNFAEWDTVATDLDGGSAVTMNYTTKSLGALTICLHVTDVAGNGLVSGSDYFKVFTYGGATGFSAGVTYRAVLVYEPTGETIGTGITFVG